MQHAEMIAWGVALAELGPSVPADAVRSFVEECKGLKDQGGVLHRLCPLLEYLEHSNGQHEDLILPEAIKQLPRITDAWLEPCHNSSEVSASATKLFASIQSVLCMAGVRLELRQSLSAVVASALVLPLLELHKGGSVAMPEADTPAAALMRSLTQPPHPSKDSAAPVSAQDAAALLSKLMAMLSSSSSKPAGPADPSSLFLDSKPITLMTALVTSILKAAGLELQQPSLSMAPAASLALDAGTSFMSPAQSFASASSLMPNGSGGSEVLLGVSAVEVGGAAAGTGAQVLLDVSKWALQVVRLSLEQLRQSAIEQPGRSNGAAAAAAAAPAAPGTSSYTGVTARAAAHLAAAAMTGLVEGEGAEQAKVPELKEQLEEVLEVLMAVASSCVSAAAAFHRPSASAAASAAPGGGASAQDRLLTATALIIQDCAALASAARTLGIEPSPALFAQMRGALMAAAALPEPGGGGGVGGGGGSRPPRVWFWDIRQPLPLSIQGGAGWGQALLCSKLAEAVSVALAACWRAGQHSFVQAMLLLPDPAAASTTEQQVATLLIARTFMLLDASEQFARVAMPVLIDTIAVSGRTTQPVETCACMVKCIAAMAAASACRSPESSWTYNQVVDILCRLVRDPSAVPQDGIKALTYACAKGMSSEYCGTLSEALGILARDMSTAEPGIRKELRMQLLSLFNDMGLRCGDNAGFIKDMAALLPAISSAVSQLHELKMGRKLSFKDLQQELSMSHRDNLSFTKLMRSLWMYIGLFKLNARDSPPQQRDAVSSIALNTPLLLISDVHGESETLFRLAAEFRERLTAAGPAAEPVTLRTTLLSACELRPGSASGPTPPLDPNKKAYLLAMSSAEVCRGGCLALQGSEDPSPISMVLGYLQVLPPGSEESAWMAYVAERVFALQLSVAGQHLRRSTAPAPGAAGPTPGAGAALAEAGASAAAVAGAEPHPGDACLQEMAVTLIHHLANTGDHEDGTAPKVVELADSFLRRLLSSHPDLYWDHDCVKALLDMLDYEEGDRPMSEVRASTSTAGASTVVWRWIKSWVAAASTRAPSRTEALLHQFLGLRSGGGGGGGGGGDDPGNLGAASAAAMRRSSDLLAICAEQRKGRGGPVVLQQDGTLALCRKQYFSGLVSGLHSAGGGGGGEDASALAEAVAEALERAVRNHHSVTIVEEKYLTAAALLASSPVPSPVDSAACFGLLKGLCAVPLARFTSDMMGLSVFAWTWVGTAAPEWLLPLTSRVVSSWCCSVDRSMGLFSQGGAGCEEEEQVLQGLQCHHRWLLYFSELWASLANKLDVQQAAMQQLFMRLLHHSLSCPAALSPHPAAAAARFRLLTLALQVCQSRLASAPQGQHAPPQLAMLHDRVLKTAALWFAQPPSFTAHITEQQAKEQVAALRDFLALLSAAPARPPPQLQLPKPSATPQPSATAAAAAAADRSPPLGTRLRSLAVQIVKRTGSANQSSPTAADQAGPVWDSKDTQAGDIIQLLKFLLSHEQERLQVWASPSEPGSGAPDKTTTQQWHKLVGISWQVDPKISLALVDRFPASKEIVTQLQHLLTAHAHEPRVQALPHAAMILAAHASSSSAAVLEALSTWAPAGPVEGLELLAGASGRNEAVKGYALRCIANTQPEKVVFFLPQLVQILRNDPGGAIQRTLLGMAARSDLFAHQLIWALQTEMYPPEEAFNPEVKRSGWQPPKDCGLWDVSGKLREKVLAGMTPVSREYWEAENSYFDQITSISGVLKKYEKDERKARCAEELAKFQVQRQDLYVPTNPDCRVISHIPSSGTPMQSAAKVPILVAFNVAQQPIMQGTAQQQEHGAAAAGEEDEAEVPTRKLACIFKVGDDVRQDVLALQVIQLLRDAFKTTGLDIYLCPYGCLPTGYERGIIEVVPNTKSRAGMGELCDGGLYDIFQADFGAPNSPAFEKARRNFIISEAGYAIASFLLQAKDRHNGNILIDAEGHLVHIDFGFILEISPGGNMGFESAAFKLSHEMTQLLDPGNTRQSAHFKLFEQLCIRGYLVARTVAEPIIAAVALMAESGLPCFGRGAPIDNLRKRFHLEMSERQAAAFMTRTIADAYQKWTTGVYDALQNVQNRIPF